MDFFFHLLAMLDCLQSRSEDPIKRSVIKSSLVLLSSLLQASLSLTKKLPQRCPVIPLSALQVDALCAEKMQTYFYCPLSSLSHQGEKIVEDPLSIPLHPLRP